MSLESLAAKVLERERVQTLIQDLTLLSVLRDLPAVSPDGPEPVIDWTFAIRVAGVLCRSQNEAGSSAALRIAQGCLVQTGVDIDVQRAAAVVLDRMGNRRSLDLAEARLLIDDTNLWTAAPVPVRLDVIRSRMELAIPLSDGTTLASNPFQRELWTLASSRRWISVSAPTSAGKSFIVRTWLAEQAELLPSFRAAYIVPTRALIEEVGNDLRADLPDHVSVYAIPWDGELGTGSHEVYVMTQERLHLLMGKQPDLSVDLLFVDEAQKFGDDRRGVLLQQVVDELARRRPTTQVLMASPLTSNPELLLQGAPAIEPLPIALHGASVTVNQNLLWCNQVPRTPREWTLDAVTEGELQRVGTFELPASPAQSVTKRLSLVAVALTGLESGTVVYVNTPGDAETVALQIHDALGEKGTLDDDLEIAALRDLIRRTIHRSYALVEALGRGVAFHYGSMPQLVRQEIERLFRAEKLRYLVCTSTLLEGVNLPCRLLIARNPQKGRGNPMSAGDFWNLAGRAGRWGKEFQGNIVCVDAAKVDVWPDPPRRRELQQLRRSSDPSLRDVDPLIEYIDAGAIPDDARASPMLEAVFSMLSSRLLTAGTVQGVPALADNDVPRIEASVNAALSKVQLPSELLVRHAGIGPLALGRLLDTFRSVAHWQPLVLPSANEQDALNVYVGVLGVAHDVLGADFGNEKRQYVIGLLVIDWMRGLPLSVIIEKRLRWLRSNRPKFKLSTEIRNVMKDVETVARFEAPRYLSCYVDVLAWHLRSIGETEAAHALPDVSMMLELGVSRTTEVSMMSLGLSRTSVVELSEFVTDDHLSREEALAWLSSRDLDGFDLPAIVREEVRRIRDR